MQKPPQLYEVSANIRASIFEELKAKRSPSVGEFEPEKLKQAFERGEPQMGAQKFTPEGIFFEFIFPNPVSGTVILPVFVRMEERIVFLPVPKWVIQNIWQGDISGSYVFESQVEETLEKYRLLLSKEGNQQFFEDQSDFVKW